MALRLGLGLRGGGGRSMMDADAVSYFSRAGIISGTTAVPQYDGRVNYALYSEQFDNAWWSKGNTSVIANTTETTDPLGTNLADKLIEDTATNTHRLSFNSGSSFSVTSGTPYTVSVYVKNASRQYFILASVNGGTSSVIFDLVNGTVASNGTSTARSITNVGNGWYRVTATGITTNVIASYIFGLTNSSTNTGPYLGDGTSSVYLWGAQLEAGSSATAYLPTTAFSGQGVSSTLTVTPRQQILDFIKGVKALGIWSNVVFWPLRSSQNAGTGTTAYSLGGLGLFNGTLTNGPTWSNNGLTSTGIGQHLLTSLGMGSLRSVIGVSTPNTFHSTARLFSNSASGNSYPAQQSPSSSAEFYNGASFTTFAYPSFNQVGAFTFDAVAADTSIQGYRNGVAGTPSAVAVAWPSTGNFTVFRTASTFMPASVALAGASNILLSQSQVSSLYALYKSTLGSGLNLP